MTMTMHLFTRLKFCLEKYEGIPFTFRESELFRKAEKSHKA